MRFKVDMYLFVYVQENAPTIHRTKFQHEV